MGTRTGKAQEGISPVVAVVVMMLLLGSVTAIGCSPRTPAQPQTIISAKNREVVAVGHPTRKSLVLTTTQPARIEGLEQTPIYSKLAAYVDKVLVDYGDKVAKDQPLVKLSAPEVDADVAQKQALLEQARAEHIQAEAGANAADAAITTAEARAKEALAETTRSQADIERWRSELQRIEQLASSGSLNRQLVDETQQKYRAAEATLARTLAAVDAVKAFVVQEKAEAAKAAADVLAAQSRIRVAEANIVQAEATRSYLTVRAPFDGIVTLRQVDPGHLVQPGGGNSHPLLAVARHDKMRILIAVPEVEASYVDVGDPVSVDVPSLRGTEFKGIVTRTGVALDPSNRSLTTIVDVDNSDGRLRPGLYSVARIILQEQQNALTLPAAAVVRQGKEAYCYRLVGEKAVKTAIQLGIKVGDDFEIAGGVSDDDVAILNKASSLKDGQLVEVLKSETKK